MGAMQTIPTSSKGDYPMVSMGLSVVTWAKDRWPNKLTLTQVTNTDGPYMMSPEYKEWLKNNVVKEKLLEDKGFLDSSRIMNLDLAERILWKQ